jgi:hypothetical protein
LRENEGSLGDAPEQAESNSVSLTPESPLRGLRLIVTRPPSDWFGGVDNRFALDMADELRRLGAVIFEIDVARFAARDDVYISDAISSARTFQADVAIALPNAGYAIACRTSTGENIFADILEIPTIMIWDHGALQFATPLLGPLPDHPEESITGCIARFRDALDRPAFVHYSPDRGHIAAMDELGILDGRQVHPFIHTAWPAYVRHGRTAPSSTLSGSKLAFAGNLYLDAASKLRFRKNEILAGIESRVLREKRAHLTTSLWDLVVSEIDRLDPTTRAELHLTPDSSFFWSFLYAEIELVGTTAARLNVLSALQHPCDFYGNFIEPQMTPALSGFGLRFRRNLDCVSELPFLYQGSDLMIDVVHPGYISGVSPKILACMACGGMVLFDYRRDLHEAMGGIASQVMFHDVGQLNSLIETYLGDHRKRREIAKELQHRVLSEFTFDAFATQVLVDRPHWRDTRIPAEEVLAKTAHER